MVKRKVWVLSDSPVLFPWHSPRFFNHKDQPSDISSNTVVQQKAEYYIHEKWASDSWTSCIYPAFHWGKEIIKIAMKWDLEVKTCSTKCNFIKELSLRLWPCIFVTNSESSENPPTSGYAKQFIVKIHWPLAMLNSLYIVSLNLQVNPRRRENHDSSFMEYSLDRLSHWSHVTYQS